MRDESKPKRDCVQWRTIRKLGRVESKTSTKDGWKWRMCVVLSETEVVLGYSVAGIGGGRNLCDGRRVQG